MAVLTLPNADRLPLSVRAKALVFEDPRSRALLQRIQQVAPSQATVLITGETGTGKEIVARHLHELSRRANQPFVAVNCGAFSENLAEAEQQLKKAIELEPENQSYLLSLAQAQLINEGQDTSNRTLQLLLKPNVDPRVRTHAQQMIEELDKHPRRGR